MDDKTVIAGGSLLLGIFTQWKKLRKFFGKFKSPWKIVKKKDSHFIINIFFYHFLYSMITRMKEDRKDFLIKKNLDANLRIKEMRNESRERGNKSLFLETKEETPEELGNRIGLEVSDQVNSEYFGLHTLLEKMNPEKKK